MVDDYFAGYDDPAVHRAMIGDHVRTDAYRRAIEASIRPDDVVLDLGCGTGILALFAARAGARRVIAVDNSSIVEVAKAIGTANGYGDRIEFVRGRSESLGLDTRVDVIVSEWMGFFALAEAMFESVIAARDAHLAEGGRMIPAHLRLFLAPVDDELLFQEEGAGLWNEPVYGFDFSPMVDHEIEHLSTHSVSIPPRGLIAEPEELCSVDCARDPVAAFYFDANVDFVLERGGTLHGFAGWFETDLAPEVVLGTGPETPSTHWRQSWFPIRPLEVAPGDRLAIQMRAEPAQTGDRRAPLYFLEGRLERDGEDERRFFFRYHTSFD